MPFPGRILLARRLPRAAVLLLCATLLVAALPVAVLPARAQAGNPPTLSPYVYMPMVRHAGNAYKCPTTSSAHYDSIPYEGAVTDRPAEIHADLNLAMRGYKPVSAPLQLVWYNGATDPQAPQMRGLFPDGRVPIFAAAYQVYDWNWDPTCGSLNGCRGSLLDDWPTTLLGMATGHGEAVRPPNCSASLYSGGYIALVLYAAEQRITLKYTREDNVVHGYTVHIENVCVDPNLLQLYGELNSAGRPRLPALRPGETLGTASGDPILVAVRDEGRFLDPRSQKDWWSSSLVAGPEYTGPMLRIDRVHP